jgi:hypothetical protein
MSFGNKHTDDAFDRWKTGNYGEAQFDSENELYDLVEKTCVNCLCQCPIFERYLLGEDVFDDFMDRCLIIKGIIEKNCVREQEFEDAMEKAYWDEQVDEYLEAGSYEKL